MKTALDIIYTVGLLLVGSLMWIAIFYIIFGNKK